MSVTRSYSGSVAICYVLPVLWMTSYLPWPPVGGIKSHMHEVTQHCNEYLNWHAGGQHLIEAEFAYLQLLCSLNVVCSTLGGILDERSHCYTLEVSFYSYTTTSGSTTVTQPYTEEACILPSAYLLFRRVSFMRHFYLKYADRINAKYAAQIRYKITWNRLPHLFSQGSGLMNGAILLVTRWST